MKPGLEPGKFAEWTVHVTPAMCPHFDGVLVHPIYATWTLVHHMELTGRKLLAPYLEDHEEAVGAHISVDHRSPAFIGSDLVIRAEAETVGRHKLTCKMSARCGSRTLASGLFVQIIMSKKRLQSIIDRHKE